MLKEIIEKVEEGREQAKKAYLSNSYTIKDIEDKVKKAKSGSGRAYIQYKTSKSRKGVAGGYVVEIDNGKVVIDNPFGDGTVEVDVKDITMLDILKGR